MCRIRKALIIFELIIVSMMLAPQAYCEDKIAIGVGVVSEANSISSLLSSDAPRDKIVRALTTKTLIAPRSGSGRFDLILARSFNVSADRRVWNFYVPDDLVFSTTSRVTKQDLDYSLHRCKEQGKFNAVMSVECKEASAKVAHKGLELSFSLIPQASKDAASIQSFISDLGSCPILERYSSELFGDLLGTGTNFVSTGDFRVSAFSPTGSVVLQRALPSGLEGAASSFEIRSFVDVEAALSALRAGTLDLVIGKNFDPVQAISDDTTLISGSCTDFGYLARRGLSYDCNWNYDLNRLKYVG